MIDQDEDDAPARASRHESARGLRGPRGPLAPVRLRLEVLGMRFLYWFVPLLPRETLLALGRALGRWGYVVARSERRVALANLDLAYGDSLTPREKRRIARRSFESFGQVGIELFWGRRLTPRLIERIVEIDDASIRWPRDILAQGKGLVAVTAHIGSWEITNHVAAALDFPLSTLVKRLRNDRLNALVNANRRHTGGDVIYHDDAARGILRALRAGRAVPIPLDQNTRPDRGGVYVPFFGKPVAASRAAALFSLRMGTPVVPSVCFPLPGGRYRIRWGPPIPAPTEGTRDERERELTARCLAWIEARVRERPDAWLWMYRRWKYRPTPDASGFPYYSKCIPEADPAPAARPQESRA